MDIRDIADDICCKLKRLLAPKVYLWAVVVMSAGCRSQLRLQRRRPRSVSTLWSHRRKQVCNSYSRYILDLIQWRRNEFESGGGAPTFLFRDLEVFEFTSR